MLEPLLGAPLLQLQEPLGGLLSPPLLTILSPLLPPLAENQNRHL